MEILDLLILWSARNVLSGSSPSCSHIAQGATFTGEVGCVAVLFEEFGNRRRLWTDVVLVAWPYQRVNTAPSLVILSMLGVG